jgi:hypothetical protein
MQCPRCHAENRERRRFCRVARPLGTEEETGPAMAPGNERPYQIDDEWSRAVLARRTGEVVVFAPHPRRSSSSRSPTTSRSRQT